MTLTAGEIGGLVVVLLAVAGALIKIVLWATGRFDEIHRLIEENRYQRAKDIEASRHAIRNDTHLKMAELEERLNRDIALARTVNEFRAETRARFQRIRVVDDLGGDDC